MDGLSINAIIDIREQIVLVFYIAEPPFVNTISVDVVVELREPEEVFPGPLDRVFHMAAGLHDERPVRTLRKEQFSGRLIERPAQPAVRVREGLRQLDQAGGRLLD